MKMAVGPEPLLHRCEGVAASWCPNCGSCACPPMVLELDDGGRIEMPMRRDDPGCPLHAPGCLHAENQQCYNCEAWFMTVDERDEHEALCAQ